MRHFVYACYLDYRGENMQISGDSMEEIRDVLSEVGYSGPKVVVTKANDEVVGWVDAMGYKSA
jgi:hypothetical protein